MLGPFSTIGVAREAVSLENPGARDRRVSLLPEDVRMIVESGRAVSVEDGAGFGLGIRNEEYEAAGANIEDTPDLYSGKDLVIKFKGPSLDAISHMDPGSTMFCMAHILTFPERRAAYERGQVSVLAMEEVVDSPCRLPRDEVVAQVAMKRLLQSLGDPSDLHVASLGCSRRLVGALRTAARAGVASIQVLSSDPSIESVEPMGGETIYLFDSQEGTSPDLLAAAASRGALLLDVHEFGLRNSDDAVREHLERYQEVEFGRRRIECLHQTGQAGAGYGLKLVTEVTKRVESVEDAKVVVLGYGNVAIGAVDECVRQGVRKLFILGREQTRPDRIEKWIADADVIINGVDLPAEQRGKQFLISRHHTQNVLQSGAVVIDLVGGSPTERSAIEAIEQCTFLDNPHFFKDGVCFGALWGWPMIGMMEASARRYSQQIRTVLLEEGGVLDGLDSASPGVRKALVLGPFCPWIPNQHGILQPAKTVEVTPMIPESDLRSSL